MAMKDWRKQQRTRLLEQRAALAEDERRQLQEAVVAQLRTVLQHQQAEIIGIYWPIKGELDCRQLAAELIARGCTVTVPVINSETNRLDFSAWQPDMAMETGTWNIPVPENKVWVEPELFLIPLVGFDADNYRLGYGGGYYDRTLAAQNKAVTTIGVGLEMGRFETIYPHQHDIKMNMIVTEAGIQQG